MRSKSTGRGLALAILILAGVLLALFRHEIWMVLAYERYSGGICQGLDCEGCWSSLYVKRSEALPGANLIEVGFYSHGGEEERVHRVLPIPGSQSLAEFRTDLRQIVNR